jgi:demethylmenaquinone methyltransferase/2-methoxy-6-polyprenyl-1,4-benzoquinol methylase
VNFSSPSEKRAFTRRLFTDLAPRYEMVNQVMSLGQVEGWRRYAAAQALVPSGGRVLDVAAGEGGLTRAVANRWPTARIIGVDFTSEMVRLGRARTNCHKMGWIEGDALSLPFPDAHFDAVVNGFMLRNVVDVEATLAEQTRVVRPGGRVVCLEMTWPKNPLFRPIFRIYFGGLVPLVGWLLTGRMYAYRYLPRSVEEFLNPDELTKVMEGVGLCMIEYRLLNFGTVAVHVGVKESG